MFIQSVTVAVIHMQINLCDVFKWNPNWIS